jgi:beta-glucanase (GH16 family)
LAQRAPDQQSAEAWTLTFSDEFKESELDLAKWTPHDLANARAYDAAAAEVKGGALHLAAKPGIVTSYGKFAQTFGRFEVRCRTSGASGTPEGRLSIRLLPLPSGSLPSIEVVQTAGKATFENQWGTEQTERSYGDTVALPGLAAGSHTIAIEWERDHISWFVDGKEKLRSADGVPRQPMYLSLEADGNQAALFDIEYVRIYRRGSTGEK